MTFLNEARSEIATTENAYCPTERLVGRMSSPLWVRLLITCAAIAVAAAEATSCPTGKFLKEGTCKSESAPARPAPCIGMRRGLRPAAQPNPCPDFATATDWGSCDVHQRSRLHLFTAPSWHSFYPVA